MRFRVKGGKGTPEFMLGIRSTGKRLETAVNQFKDSRGRSVTVVGIEHVGEPRYFEELRRWVDQHGADAVVRFERTAESDEIETRTAFELEALRALRKTTETQFDIWREVGLNLIAQRASVMSDDPTWIGSGMRDLDVVRAFGPASLLGTRQVKGPDKAAGMVRGLAEKNASARMFLVRRALLLSLLRRGAMHKAGTLHPDPWMRRVFYEWREVIELNEVLAMEEDVVMIWGAPHMPGFAEGLSRNGFSLVKTQWFVVVDKGNQRGKRQ